jgi:predicted transcriptional regulator
MKNKRALLVVETTSKAFDRFAEVLKNPAQSKYKDCIILSFPSFEILGKVVTGARLELLSAIRVYRPKSIQELARLVKRDFKNVYQDVKLLAEYGLIELKENGARKASHPIAKFTELLIAA